MQTFTDEQLVAYADQELAPGEAQRIASAAQSDPQLAGRIARFTESRRLLADAFAQQLDEPVPQRLLDVLRANNESKVVPLARRQRPAWSNWMPMALAASIALGVGLLVGKGWGPEIAPQEIAFAGLPQDVTVLERALQTLASGEVLAGESGGAPYEIVPTASLRLPSGVHCREFESAVGSQRARGLACQNPAGGWNLQAVASISADAQSGTSDESYRPAGESAGGPAIPAGAQRLSPAQEQALIESNWR